MSAKEQTGIQKHLFEVLANIIPENISMVDELSALIGVSNDSIYRRLRGETALTIEEVALICKRFNISFDYLSNIGDFKSVSFLYNPLKSEEDYIKYLTSIRDDMIRIARAKEKYIIYAAEDVPLFHNFRTEDLTAFKAFYWLNSVINIEELRGVKYSKEVISSTIIELCMEIYDLYTKIPSSEIWSSVTPSSLIMQIDYFWQAGFFESKEAALNICNLASQEFMRIQKEAELGCKFNIHGKPLEQNSYTLYHSDIEVGNNSILVSIDNQKALYLTHNTLNKIITYNKPFCEETENWMKIIMKKSTPLSSVAEKQRNQFFRKITNKIEAIKQSIEQEED